jgi:hypothetical protein
MSVLLGDGLLTHEHCIHLRRILPNPGSICLGGLDRLGGPLRSNDGRCEALLRMSTYLQLLCLVSTSCRWGVYSANKRPGASFAQEAAASVKRRAPLSYSSTAATAALATAREWRAVETSAKAVSAADRFLLILTAMSWRSCLASAICFSAL